MIHMLIYFFLISAIVELYAGIMYMITGTARLGAPLCLVGMATGFLGFVCIGIQYA